MGNDGLLPKPRKRPSALAAKMLDLYDRAERGERDARALLFFEIPRAPKKDLADYYAGVRARLIKGD